ncbi:tRNA (adenosine(37)-N6)-threonylcarbamoyltransferase complex ATPase subunit type 1 TsaE [Desulfococcaceae bacterium HSG8]|nr:tRNA (adenosine(37)-N6)-threonylcarbamoyltransferase complex ATPase subunit type 1 TsaE [Desulfococcaceae bacterium HSG8]
MTIRQFQTITSCLEDTRELGRKIGALLRRGTVIALTGDLGSGKTSLIQGLARGLEVPDEYYITSPSYTLINEYPGRFPLFHADLYRLENPDDFEDTGIYEILHSGEGVVAVEWAERLGDEEILSDCVTVHLEILDDDSRRISVSAYGALNLIKKLSGGRTEQQEPGNRNRTGLMPH